MPEENEPRDAHFRTDDLSGAGYGGRATVGAGLALIATPIKIVVQFGAIAIIARLVPPTEFGVVAMTTPVIAICIALSQFGLAHPIIQRPVVTHRLASTLFWANMALAATIGSAIVALSPFAALFYGEPRVGPVFAALSLSVLFTSALVIYSAIIRRRMRFRALELILFAGEFTGAMCCLLAAFMGASYWSIVVQQVTTHAATFAGLALATGWVPSRPPLKRAAWREARSAIGFGGNVAVYGLLNQTTQAVGVVVSGRVFDEAAAAVYYRAWTLSNYPEARFGGALAGAFLPALCRAHETPEAFRALYADILRRMAALFLPMAVLLLTGSDLIVAILLGPQWVAAGPILQWLGLLALAAPLNTTLVWALIAADATAILVRQAVIALVLVLTGVVTAAQFGLEAMAAVYGLLGLLVIVPMLLVFAVGNTALRAGALLRRYLQDVAAALMVAGLVAGARSALGLSAVLPEVLLVGTVIALGYGAYGLIDPALRGDILAAVRRFRKSA